tara:strand:+ start:623 stop:832 length:210 start_codon:yes stop_codon:yes gene_type:complete
MEKITNFFALYYDMVHRQGKSLVDVKLKILKDRQDDKISDLVYFSLMKGLAKEEQQFEQLKEIDKFLDS